MYRERSPMIAPGAVGAPAMYGAPVASPSRRIAPTVVATTRTAMTPAPVRRMLPVLVPVSAPADAAAPTRRIAPDAVLVTGAVAVLAPRRTISPDDATLVVGAPATAVPVRRTLPVLVAVT